MSLVFHFFFVMKQKLLCMLMEKQKKVRKQVKNCHSIETHLSYFCFWPQKCRKQKSFVAQRNEKLESGILTTFLKKELGESFFKTIKI
jgi:hypothetical protein